MVININNISSHIINQKNHFLDAGGRGGLLPVFRGAFAIQSAAEGTTAPGPGGEGIFAEASEETDVDEVAEDPRCR